MNSEMIQMDSRNRKLHRIRGFSLVEILIVLALIGLLATLVVTNVGGIFKGRQIDTAKTFVDSSLSTPLEAYFIDVGSYPASLKDLVSNPGKGRWKGPYTKPGKKLKDPWGNDYHYQAPGQKSGGDYDLWSNGPDAQSGTADDIGNWGD